VRERPDSQCRCSLPVKVIREVLRVAVDGLLKAPKTEASRKQELLAAGWACACAPARCGRRAAGSLTAGARCSVPREQGVPRRQKTTCAHAV
jgi:hypothetical protein